MKLTEIAAAITAVWPAVKYSLDERKKRRDLEKRVERLEAERDAQQKREDT